LLRCITWYPFICLIMNWFIVFVVQKRKLSSDRITGRKRRSSRWLNKDCHFGKTVAKSSQNYQPPDGIFSAHSNSTVAMFLAFNKKGIVKSVRHSLEHFGKKKSKNLVKMQNVAKSGLKYDDILKNTIFSRKPYLNHWVRQCIKRKFVSTANKLRHRSLSKIITRCRHNFIRKGSKKNNETSMNIVNIRKLQQNSFQRNGEH